MTIGKRFALACLIVCLFAGSSHAQQVKSSSAVLFGVRQHTDHPSDPESPFGDADLSYLAAYEFREGSAAWQVGVSYAPHVTSTSVVNEVESVMTPQLHLLFKERLFMLGVGIMKHYIREAAESHWSDLYWQLQAGVNLPITGSMTFQGVAYYAFDDWGDVGDLDTGEIEFGVNLCYAF